MFPELKARLAASLSAQAVQTALEEALAPLLGGEKARVFLMADLRRFATEPMEANPVMRTFLQEEAALHEAQVVDNATWRRLCPRADHGHVLVGPLLQGGELYGILAVTRQDTQAPFGPTELRLMNRIALYASNRLAQIPGEGEAEALPWSDLSPRERDVAGYVRQGLRNTEIADRLSLSEHTVKQNLKSVFRKLGLRSRTELALHAARR